MIFQNHFRELPLEFLCKLPVSRTGAAIQQAGSCQEKGTNTQAHHFSATMVVIYNPRNQLRVHPKIMLYVAMDGRNNNQICLADFINQKIGINRKQAVGLGHRAGSTNQMQIE